MQALDEQFPGFELEIQGIDKVRQTHMYYVRMSGDSKTLKRDPGLAYR
jgi:hypothetical protein